MVVNISMEGNALGIFETVMDSFVHAMQSFSMDEDYSMFLIGGKNVLGGNTISAEVYGIIISILNVMAPILGGAVILDILTGVFPRLKVSVNPFRNKFIFSELSEKSITLAEDILQNKNFEKLIKKDDTFLFIKRKPLIIFTDAYPDPKSENTSELFTRARAIKSICLKTDIKHLPVRRSKSVFYFLMDEDEHTNLESVNDLLNEPGCMILWPKPSANDGSVRTTIIVLCQSDFSITLVNSIMTKRKETISEALVRPICDYSNMAMNLVHTIPLFTALMDGPVIKQKHVKMSEYALIPEKALHVTLIGSGAIAEEIFKTIFWCGQMIDYQLNIHVLSKTAKDMKTRIGHDCPELFRSCSPDDDILKTHTFCQNGRYAPPYAVCEDFLDTINAEFIQDYPDTIIGNTNYFVVALGSDEKNIHIATLLFREIKCRHIAAGKNIHPVIVPIVFDDQLADTLKNDIPGIYEPYILPYGTLKERFSCKNIFMADTIVQSQNSGKLYDLAQQKARVKDEYQYWSNITKTIHAPYKLFSLSYYLNKPLKWQLGDDFRQSQISVKKNDDIDSILSWMEHRRWNAYLRSKGFSCPTDIQHARYTAVTGENKDIQLRLHPCLVEADIKKSFLHPQQLPIEEPSRYDNLDLTSLYDYLIQRVLSSDNYAPEDLKVFFDKEKLLFKTNEKLIEKYHISLDKLSNEEYRQYDGISFDSELQNLIVFKGQSPNSLSFNQFSTINP